jgi:hypothetical protein
MILRASAVGNRDRLWVWVTALMAVVLLGVVLGTFRDYGITWDEGVHNRHGRQIVRWYTTLGEDTSAIEHLHLYGGVFEVVAQTVQALSPLDTFDTRHLVNALFGLLGVAAAWGLGFHLGGPAVGLLSALFLALTPSFYGHAFANPKDVPFASLYALAAWVALRASRRVSRLGWREVLATGVAVGLAAGVRSAGIALFGYVAVLWAASLWFGLRDPKPQAERRPRPELARLGVAWLGTLVVGWSVMVAFWPWAQLDPVRNPLRGLLKLSSFTRNYPVLHGGEVLTTGTIPRTYVPEWLALTLPEFYFVAWSLGIVALAVFARRPLEKAGLGKRAFEILWIGALAAAPVLWVVLRHTPLYNGYRHLLFVVPFLAVLAGLSAARFLQAPLPRPATIGAALVLAACGLVTVVDMVQLHPYQYVYFNRLVGGGLPGAVGQYDTDYWGAACKEAVEWTVDHYSRRDLRQAVRITARSEHALLHHLGQSERGRRRFHAVRFGGRYKPHVVFVSASPRHRKRDRGKLVHVVERQGAPLLYVYEIREPE